MKTAYFTIAAWNYLHFARALAASLHPFKGDAELILAVADTERDDIGFDRVPEFDRLITFADLRLPDRAAMADSRADLTAILELILDAIGRAT